MSTQYELYSFPKHNNNDDLQFLLDKVHSESVDFAFGDPTEATPSTSNSSSTARYSFLDEHPVKIEESENSEDDEADEDDEDDDEDEFKSLHGNPTKGSRSNVEQRRKLREDERRRQNRDCARRCRKRRKEELNTMQKEVSQIQARSKLLRKRLIDIQKQLKFVEAVKKEMQVELRKNAMQSMSIFGKGETKASHTTSMNSIGDGFRTFSNPSQDVM